MLDRKRCTKCNKVKPLEEYHVRKDGIGGRRSACMSCAKRSFKPNPSLQKLTCKDCGLTMPTFDFYTDKASTTGYRKDCKECFKAKKNSRLGHSKWTQKPKPSGNWKPVEGFENLYEVADDGRIYSLPLRKQGNKGGHVMSTKPDAHGYEVVQLRKEGKVHSKKVHRLVALAHIPNPDNKPQVNHIDGIKTHNNKDNLEWVTDQENKQHAWENGLAFSPFQSGETSCMAKFSDEEIAHALRLKEKGMTHKQVADATGMSESYVGFLAQGKYRV